VLFFPGCPSAIAGLIIPVVIDTVYGKAVVCGVPHVGVKILECFPPLANLDPTTTIKTEFGIFWIAAAT
jgi:hypothetical protein